MSLLLPVHFSNAGALLMEALCSLFLRPVNRLVVLLSLKLLDHLLSSLFLNLMLFFEQFLLPDGRVFR